VVYGCNAPTSNLRRKHRQLLIEEIQERKEWTAIAMEKYASGEPKEVTSDEAMDICAANIGDRPLFTHSQTPAQ
jgi:hypothetical protein